MAEKRMFTQKIIDSDAFLEMPLSAQALYFHLNMRADDDGFVNNPKKITKYVNASEDDLKILLLKRFVIGFDSGVIVIKHWRMHNTIKKDRYHATDYIEEFSMLGIKQNKSYTDDPNYPKALPECEQDQEWNQSGTKPEPEWNQPGTKAEPQIRLDKNRLEESREVEETTLTGGKEEAPHQGRRYSLDEAKRIASQPDLPQSVKDALCTWLEYKYLDRRDKYAERGMNQLVSSIKKRVTEYGEDPVSEIILYSVEREWQGIGWDNLEKRFKRQKKVYAQDDLFYRTGKTLGNRVSRRLGLPEDTEETRQAYAAEMEACARETGADVGTEIKDAVFFSQSDPFWQSRIVDAKSFRLNFRKILADMRRKDS